MEILVSNVGSAPTTGHRLNTGILRQWSSPEVILVVTDLHDEESIQFHAIQQARQSRAKVLLVEVDEECNAIARTQHLHRVLSAPRETAERMTSHLRRSGIACEPVVVRNLRADQIPSIARSCCADRVLVSAPSDGTNNPDGSAVADRIIDGLDIPVCVVSRNLTLVSRYQRPSRRIALVLSIRGRNDIPIAFSSRFAQENHSQLTIMHIFPKEGNGHRMGNLQASLVSQLPSAILREAELLCPVEIAVREGDPATEILNYESCFNQDFVVLAPPRDAGPIGFGMNAARKMIRQARCPVIVLNERSDTRGDRGKTETCSAHQDGGAWAF